MNVQGRSLSGVLSSTFLSFIPLASIHGLGEAVLTTILCDHAAAKTLADYMLWFIGDYAVFLGDCNQQLWTANHLQFAACNQL